MSNGKIALIAGLTILSIIILWIGVGVSFSNRAADAENMVIQQKDNCTSVYDNGIKAIIEMAQVDTNTKQFLKELISSADVREESKIQNAYGTLLNGNPGPFLALMSGIAGTDFTLTAENVQREISAQRSAMLTCSTALNISQRELKSVLGMDGSGRVVKWPQSWLNMNYPSPQADRSLEDNDLDGHLTVLDYRPPVNLEIRDSFGSGEGIPPVTIYPTEPGQ